MNLNKELFSKEWWNGALQLNEETDADVVKKVIKGFKLVREPKGFGFSYVHETGKTTSGLADRINEWIQSTFPYNNIMVVYEKTYKTINFIEKPSNKPKQSNLFESNPRTESSPYHDLVLNKLGEIELAARKYNFPIDDVQYAFETGRETILSDDIWAKLKNTDSYKIKDLEQAIKIANKNKEDWKSIVNAIQNEEELPLPLVLNWDNEEYYLVDGNTRLMIYKALGVIPVVLVATINSKEKELEEVTEEATEDAVESKNRLHKALTKFIKYAIKELQITSPPSGLTLSYDTRYAKENHTFGYFDPSTNKIWLYIKNRNAADILRTLAHELVHRKQAEENRILPDSGQTGSPIENEANAMAGVLLRKYGENNSDIYEGLKKNNLLSEVGEDLSSAYPWKYKGGYNPTYAFTAGQTEYNVIFRNEGDGIFERMYFPFKKDMIDMMTGEGKAIPINATVMAITLNFMETNNDWYMITIHPIDSRRYNLVNNFLYKNVPLDKYDIEKTEQVFNITRKIN